MQNPTLLWFSWKCGNWWNTLTRCGNSSAGMSCNVFPRSKMVLSNPVKHCSTRILLSFSCYQQSSHFAWLQMLEHQFSELFISGKKLFEWYFKTKIMKRSEIRLHVLTMCNLVKSKTEKCLDIINICFTPLFPHNFWIWSKYQRLRPSPAVDSFLLRMRFSNVSIWKTHAPFTY